MSPPRFVAIHGHFYQPPRESPGSSASRSRTPPRPYHDWNERVTAECYAPNTAARRVDAQNRILDVVDNFAPLAFDVGPTLMAWLEHERADVYRAILEADRDEPRGSRGHGNAIAQAYGHAILPLCSRRDKVTQVRWGLADFRHRFGREPEGMWLPETAVDQETLEVLAEEGVRFTLLAPRQAAGVREPGGRVAARVGGAGPAPGVPLRAADRAETLALFFYDGPVSHASPSTASSARATRWRRGSSEAFDESAPHPQLVHVATDGETYGHHHRFGEMALAAALRPDRGASGDAVLTNHAAFLAAHPPTAEVRVVDGSSWSCAHGVERWRADCGCRAGRHARLDTSAGAGPCGRRSTGCATPSTRSTRRARPRCSRTPGPRGTPTSAVLLDRGPASVDAFLERHALRPLDADGRVLALRCLELQRHRLLMYTSCGWFFDEISGIETVQVLRYAARVLQLARGPRRRRRASRRS